MQELPSILGQGCQVPAVAWEGMDANNLSSKTIVSPGVSRVPSLAPTWNDCKIPPCSAPAWELSGPQPSVACSQCREGEPSHSSSSGPCGAPGHPTSLFLLSLAQDFGLDVTTFRTMVGIDCPAAFLQLAFHCCSVSPSSLLPFPAGAARQDRQPCLHRGRGRKVPLLGWGAWGAIDLMGNPFRLQMQPTSRPSFLEITQCLEGILQHQMDAEGSRTTLFSVGENVPAPGTAATLNGT